MQNIIASTASGMFSRFLQSSLCRAFNTIMASAGCLKCPPRPGVSQFRTATSSCLVRTPFSTSSYAAAQATGDMLKRQQAKSAHLKGKGSGAKATLRIKKKPFVKTGKPPMPGERKAARKTARKRIVLSNTNALEVVGMRDYTMDMVGNIRLRRGAVGRGSLRVLRGRLVVWKR